jgi:hypothetical protein
VLATENDACSGYDSIIYVKYSATYASLTGLRPSHILGDALERAEQQKGR